jgi:hypothetical protein
MIWLLQPQNRSAVPIQIGIPTPTWEVYDPDPARICMAW